MPTPVIGMVGLLDDIALRTGQAFRAAGDVVLVLGETRKEIGGSEYLEVVHGLKRGPIPTLDLQRELNLQGAVGDMIREGLLASAHDVSDGGLAVALAECCFAGLDPATGLEATLDDAPGAAGLREDALLFGETQSRVVISAAERHIDRIRQIAEARSTPCAAVGRVRTDVFSLRVGGHAVIVDDVRSLRDVWANSLATAVK